MHPIEQLCCQNSHCSDAGLRGRGNLTFRGYSGKGRRMRMVYCHTCRARFSERKGTVLEQARLPDEKVREVLSHIREGCGTRATSRMVHVDKNTVSAPGKLGRGGSDCNAETFRWDPAGYRPPPGRAWPAAGSESCVVPGRPGLRSVDSQ